MIDDYDGIDYSHSNPAPDPEPKWESDQGIEAMQRVYRVAWREIREAGDPRWAGAFLNYIHLRSGTRGVKSYVNWVQKNVPREVPIFSMTFGQMFEEAIANRGMHPFNSTRTQTFWTGNWMKKIDPETPRSEWLVYEGYGIVTRPHGWSVIYQEDRSRGLSAGMYSSRIHIGRWAEKRPGVLVRTVSSNLWADATGLQLYPQNMGVLPAPSAIHRLNDYVHLYGDETYDGAIERIILLANAVADFMNDYDFHILEDLKRDIRRHAHARPVIEGELHSGLDKKIPKGLLSTIGDAAVLSEQLRLGKRAYDLFKVFYTGRWDGKGWRETEGGASLPETLDPDHINVYHATALGRYPVEEWLRMPEVEEDEEIAVPEF